MTDTKRRYALRLTERFIYYDPDRGSYLFRDWPAGAIVEDGDTMKLLEQINAPVERIDAQEKGAPSK